MTEAPSRPLDLDAGLTGASGAPSASFPSPTERCAASRANAALPSRKLGEARSTLYRMMRRHGLG